MAKVFRFNDDMTFEEEMKAILEAYGLSNIKIHPDFIVFFVENVGGFVEWEDDDFHYTYECDWDDDKVKWFAELLSGKKIKVGKYWDAVREFNKEAEQYDWIYRIISYLTDCRLVLFNNYEIETID